MDATGIADILSQRAVCGAVRSSGVIFARAMDGHNEHAHLPPATCSGISVRVAEPTGRPMASATGLVARFT